MPVLTGVVTYLALSGTPGHPPAADYTKTEPVEPRPPLSALTSLAPSGTAGRAYGTFSPKAETLSDARSVVDTYIAVLTFGSFDDIDTDLVDVYRITLGMSAQAGLAKEPADTYVPVLTLAIEALEKASVSATPSVTDTYVPTLTLAATLAVEIAVSDSYVPVLTMTASLAAADTVEVTDTYVPVIGMASVASWVLATREYSLTDVYTPVLTMSQGISVAGDVDDIQVSQQGYGYIEISET